MTKGKKFDQMDRIGFRLEHLSREEFEKICKLERITISENLQLLIRKYCDEWKKKNL